MLTTIVARIVAASSRHAKLVVLLAALLTALSAYYAVSHFAINTDSDTLIARDLPWRQRQEAFTKAFPQNDDLILVVIDGTTPEAAQDAADRLVARLKDRSDRFYFVRLPPEQTFFSKGRIALPACREGFSRLPTSSARRSRSSRRSRPTPACVA